MLSPFRTRRPGAIRHSSTPHPFGWRIAALCEPQALSLWERDFYTEPIVLNRALGWISFWLMTTVWPRKRSMIERT